MTDFYSVWLALVDSLVPSHVFTIYGADGSALWSFDWGSWAMWIIWVALMVWVLTLSTRLFVKLWRRK